MSGRGSVIKGSGVGVLTQANHANAPTQLPRKKMSSHNLRGGADSSLNM